MKVLRLSIALIFTLWISSPFSIATDTKYKLPSKDGPGAPNAVSMDFQDANLKTVLKVFSQQSGLNFIASQNVQDRTVTVYFDNVKVADALNYIINANGLAYEQEPGTNIFIVKETGKPEVETITKIYELKYAQLSSLSGESGGEAKETGSGETEILSIIKNVLSKNGAVVADKRSNSLIVKDVPSQFPIVEEVLARLDVRTQQVMIKVEILETTAKLIENLGINWSDGIFGIYTGPIHNTIWPMDAGNQWGRNNSSGEGVKTAGTFDMSSTIGKMYALLNSSDTKVLARPQILTMNNETAKIELTSKEVARKYQETSTANNVTNTGTVYEEKETGVLLEVTPQISRDGYITMHLKPSVTDLELSRYTDQYDTHKRGTETTVIVKDGETVVMGGLIKMRKAHGLKKVPFLGDMPLVGLAFRYRTKDDSDKELVIFITPQIAKESSYMLGSISEREQEKPKAVREKEIKTVLDLLGG